FDQSAIRPAYVIDPDGCVDENHDAERRLGGTSKSRLEPPSAARRRAASRSIRAVRAARSRLAVSRLPTYSRAAASNSSSRFTVVRMAGSKGQHQISHQKMLISMQTAHESSGVGPCRVPHD